MSTLGPILGALISANPEVEASSAVMGGIEERVATSHSSDGHTAKSSTIAHHWRMSKTEAVEADYIVSKERQEDTEAGEDKEESKAKSFCCSCFGFLRAKTRAGS